jgi:hypothetical protein
MGQTLMVELLQLSQEASKFNQAISQQMLQLTASLQYTTVEARFCISTAMYRRIWRKTLRPLRIHSQGRKTKADRRGQSAAHALTHALLKTHLNFPDAHHNSKIKEVEQNREKEILLSSQNEQGHDHKFLFEIIAGISSENFMYQVVSVLLKHEISRFRQGIPFLVQGQKFGSGRTGIKHNYTEHRNNAIHKT